jgi:hypothetical protein
MSGLKIESEDALRIEDPASREGYEVLDAVGGKIGRAESIFVNERYEIEYVRVKAGLLGRKKLLLPVEMVAVDDEKQTLSLR